MTDQSSDNWKSVMDSLHRQTPCDWPVVYDMDQCCGMTPCSMQWRGACDETGGCIDRSTCGGCDEPFLPEREGEAK